MDKQFPEGGPKIKIGRRPTDEADHLRTKVWYLAVKARGNWSDYRLDIEFARDDGEKKRDGMSRRRTFEEVRRSESVPTHGTHAKRSFDLIRNVDAHPDFSGTAKYFYSPFWELLKGRTMTLPEAHAFVSKCLDKSNVLRPSEKLYFVLRTSPVHARVSTKVASHHVYAAALDVLIKGMSVDLDLLALVGGLFREAFLVCELEIASVLKARLNNLLEEFSAQAWLTEGTGNRLHLLAERRILFWQMDKNIDGAGLYDDFPPGGY